MNKDQELENKRKKYREWVEKNPYPIEHGMEMKECEGCYCQMFYNSGYDFCFDCLDCQSCGHDNYDPNFGNCCACYDPKSRFKTKKKRKKLTFMQRQRLHWEEVKQDAEDRIDELKDEEDADDIRTAKDIENMRRWSGQEKQRILKNLTIADLYREIEQKKSLHKKEIINCHGCQQKTNQWKFNDLEQRLCSNCQEKENQWLEPYQNEKYLAEKEKKGCYNWCANDCPQQIRPEKKSETKEMICNICRKGFNSAPNKDINHYCGERAGKLYLACDNCQKKGFETEDIKYGKS